MLNAGQYIPVFAQELNERVIPFWERHSPDREYGGYFTCLLRDGQVYDTDKFIWLQARQVWTFSKLYNNQEQRQEWLDLALLGANFLEKHGRDEAGNWYFSLRQDGQPLVQAYNIFSDCFASMAFGQLYQATGTERYASIARATFSRILERQENPKGSYNKLVPGTRPLMGFSLPMILCNLCLELEPLLEPELVETTIDHCIHTVMDTFYDDESGLVLENVQPDGKLSDTFDGRLLNPGHALEAMWFIMDLGERRNDQELIRQATERALFMLDYGWDKEAGGLFYFLDRKGYPPQQLEWDQKLWWVHLEAMEAALKGLQHTGDERCAHWFKQLYDYAWPRFSDPEYGEWFGYLKRDGTPLHTAKGGKWKGCFHVPRALWGCLEVLKKLPA
ncbi:AGE family epimerase/isomerase [Phaeodactylibacter xiamenensis]|uniref:AGE family epimerase/isomerase n=1 Tax=Phaeodactylibacter xiamenensis TaxID=1524460 RepID=UPI003BAC9C87